MDDGVREELMGLTNEWDRAMVENDAEAIGRYMADDWTIIGPDGSVGDKATFLGLVKSGTLSHDAMESDDLNVRVYGDTAVVTARGVSGGKYRGQAFREVERSSSVFVRQRGAVEVRVDTPLANRRRIAEWLDKRDYRAGRSRRAHRPHRPSFSCGPRGARLS